MRVWFIVATFGLTMWLLVSPLMAGEAVQKSCPQELSEVKAKLDIFRERRESAEHSWAYFFVRARQLEEHNAVLQKQIETLKKGAKAPEAQPQETSQ